MSRSSLSGPAAPAVAAVVLNWNNAPATARCVRSLLGAAPGLPVWIVDNGSQPGSADPLRAEFPQAGFVATGANLGFARGVNAGLRAAFAAGLEAFLLVNNDAEVLPGFLERAPDLLRSDPAIGIVTGKCLSRGPRRIILHAGGRIDEGAVRGVPRGWREEDRGQYDQPGDTGWASGTLCLIPRRTLERVGFLPEAYFFGCEEYEFSTRILRAGLRIAYCPQLACLHDEAGSHEPAHPVLKAYNFTLNKFIYARRNLSPARRAWLTFRYFAYLILVLPFLPGRAWRGCRTLRDFACRYRASWLGFLDRNRVEQVTLDGLLEAGRRIGPSDSWDSSWLRSRPGTVPAPGPAPRRTPNPSTP